MGLIKKYELGRVEIAFIIIILVAVLLAGIYVWRIDKDKGAEINSFADCVAAGNPVMEKYPEQCAANGQTWTNPDQTALVPLEPYEASDTEIAFHDLPSGLQTAVRTKLADDCAAEIAQYGEDAVLSYAVASESRLVADKYAEVRLSCGAGGSTGLYVIKEGAWQFVAASHDAWPCAPLVEFGVPQTYIAECFEEPGQPLVPNPVM